MNTVIDLVESVLNCFLAAGLGHPGDDKAEKLCSTLNTEDVWEIGQAIIEESFPNGAQSFFNKVVATVNQFASVQKTENTKTLADNKTQTSSKQSRKAASG